MSALLITNCRLHDVPAEAPLRSVLVRQGVIERIGDGVPSLSADPILDAAGRILAPGFIEVHIQGAGGADILDSTPEAIQTISRTCARFGVTGFLATTVYRPRQENTHLRLAAKYTGRDLGGARLLGTHLEGPFISPHKRGMIQPDCLGDASAAILDDIYVLLGDTLKMMTVAPELPGSDDIIRTLMANGTVASFGHSKATYDQALRAFDMGIAHVTHLFNAMPSLHHRDPSPLAAIFERPGVTCQVITDGVHIHPAVLRLAYKALGPQRFVTITDGIQALGLPDGRYVYNNMEYECRNGTPRYTDGTLIGTAVPPNDLLTRLMRFTGCPLSEAIRTVTENPARVLGLDQRKGRIALGYDADLVILENDLSVNATLVGGRIVYQRPAET
ncbi:MAG TPA: N-acetylglucosamine-6-phosphate deacetylase [Sedimentisphaerales bacterium]|nr:N-acetylglucosamine-6-phosphate deacetylase [Sedimentisphaerales bacterium]